jgi:hypothetical protein
MNIRKIITSILAGVSMLAFAGISGAANIEINIHGASAQGDYWKAIAPDFIKAQTGLGCSASTVVTTKTYAADTKFSIVSATCGSNFIAIRDAAKASFEGPLSLLGDDTYASPDGTVVGAQGEKCMSASDHAALGQPAVDDPGYPGAVLAPYYRKGCIDGNCATLKCVPIHIGVSDVAGESFVQYSYGRILGPATPIATDPIERAMSAIDTTSLPSINPFVVPFSFFAHNDVKRCTKNSDGKAAAYTNCESDPTNYTASPITNITREMAVLLFSGQVTNWNEFGSDFVTLPVVTCFRHAGSGTAAGLDWAVIRGNGWGAGLTGFENRPDDVANYVSTQPIVYFNDSTNDEMACINTQAGAIGYADSDKETSVGAGKTYANSVTLAYNGERASASGIQNGRYDYFTNQWSYKSPNLNNTAGDPYGVLSYVNSLLNMSGDPSKIPSSKQPYWSTMPQMKFGKVNDASYPAK